MTINDRIKVLRKHLGLNQTDFGEKVGIAQGHMTNIETGRREVTEKSIKVICLQFNVNEEWLRTGEGEMFVEDDNVLLSQLAKQYNLDAFSRKFIETYISLPESHRDVIKSFARSLAEEASVELAPEVSIDGNTVTDPAIAAELSSYAQELEAEKRAAEKSSVSPESKEA